MWGSSKFSLQEPRPQNHSQWQNLQRAAMLTFASLAYEGGHTLNLKIFKKLFCPV
jgi:hypothetical protein